MNATGNEETMEYLLSDPLADVSPDHPIHLLPESDLPLRLKNNIAVNPIIEEPNKRKGHPQIHANVKTFRCKYCSLSFLRTTELLKHLVFHTGDTRNQCKLCKQVLSSQKRLEKHKKTHDAVSTNFQCHMCGANGFESKRTLTSHIRLHVKVCDKKFKRLSSTAVKDRVNVTFNCERCKKQFSRKSNFITHVKRHCDSNDTAHAGEKTVKTHLCWICGKLFSYKTHLIRHSYIHNGKRPFKCEYCGSDFTQRGGLMKHVEKHKRSS